MEGFFFMDVAYPLGHDRERETGAALRTPSSLERLNAGEGNQNRIECHGLFDDDFLIQDQGLSFNTFRAHSIIRWVQKPR